MRVAGRWCSLDRAIDRDGDLLDSMRSEHRDKYAARRFLRRLVDVAQRTPQRVTTDPQPPYRSAIRWILRKKLLHRCSYPMLGFGSFASAARFCTAFDELRQYFRVRQRSGGTVPLVDKRQLFLTRWAITDRGDGCRVNQPIVRDALLGTIRGLKSDRAPGRRTQRRA